MGPPTCKRPLVGLVAVALALALSASALPSPPAAPTPVAKSDVKPAVPPPTSAVKPAVAPPPPPAKAKVASPADANGPAEDVNLDKEVDGSDDIDAPGGGDASLGDANAPEDSEGGDDSAVDKADAERDETDVNEGGDDSAAEDSTAESEDAEPKRRQPKAADAQLLLAEVKEEMRDAQKAHEVAARKERLKAKADDQREQVDALRAKAKEHEHKRKNKRGGKEHHRFRASDEQTSAEASDADAKETRLFKARFDDEMATLVLRNHSRLAQFMLDAFVKDKVFTVHDDTIQMHGRIKEPKGATDHLFNAIHDKASAYYSRMHSLKKLGDEHKKKSVLHALIAEQYNNVFGEVLENGIEIMDGIVTELTKKRHYRRKIHRRVHHRDVTLRAVERVMAVYFRNEHRPQLWKGDSEELIREINKRRRLYEDHHKQKYQSYREAIGERLEGEFRSLKDVPAVVFEDLEDDDEAEQQQNGSASSSSEEEQKTGSAEDAEGGDDEADDADGGEDDSPESVEEAENDTSGEGDTELEKVAAGGTVPGAKPAAQKK